MPKTITKAATQSAANTSKKIVHPATPTTTTNKAQQEIVVTIGANKSKGIAGDSYKILVDPTDNVVKFVIAACAQRFDKPVHYKYVRKSDNAVVEGDSQVLMGRELGAMLISLDSDRFSDKTDRMVFTQALCDLGFINKGWGGKAGPTFSDIRYTPESSTGAVPEDMTALLAQFSK